MGWTVLYIAFGIVALWLLGEVLLQYKARLRWRLLAFVGFLGVVTGVLMSSVIVIGIGAAAFAVGQTLVTLSFRKGFAEGWALSGKSVAALTKRREPAPVSEPTLEVSDLEAVEPQPEPPTYQPEPLPDDTGGYAAYREPEPGAEPDAGYPGYGETADGGYGTYDGYGTQDGYAANGYPAQGGYPDGGQYGYQTGADTHAYAGYTDPYGGAQQPYPPYEQPYDPYGHQQYGGTADGYPTDPSYGTAPGYAPGAEGTPAGGIWVPQQRDDEAVPPPDQQPYPYQQGTGGYDDQYRY